MRKNHRGSATSLQRVGQVAETLLQQRGMLTRAKEASIYALWEDIVGEYNARNTETLYCSGGVLLVTTKEDAALAHAMNHLREPIRQKLNAVLGAPIVRDIHFQPREPGKPPQGRPPLCRRELEFPGSEIPSADSEALELSEEDKQTIEEIVGQIPDATISVSVRRALTKERQLNRWKQEHGYQPCSECGTLHKDSDDICVACRILKQARHPRAKVK